jgi:hypothetical protein
MVRRLIRLFHSPKEAKLTKLLEAFHGGLDELHQYLKSIKDSGEPESFSGSHLQQIINSFRVALQEHLADEVDTLLALSEYGDKLDLQKPIKEAVKNAKVSLRKTMPCIMMNHDATYEGGIHQRFPPIPAPMWWAALNIFTFWNQNLWKFTTCDFSQKPKQLPYIQNL